jgi:hypothetical protein
LLFGARFLAHKIIGRKAKYNETIVSILFIELFETLVLRRIAAFGCSIHDQNHFAFVGIRQIDDLIGGKAPEILIEEFALVSGQC